MLDNDQGDALGYDFLGDCGMARPRKAANERRSEVLYLRLTPDEMLHVESQAEIAGMDRTDFARDYLLGARIAALPESAKAAKAEAADMLLAIDELTRQTKYVGHNVNQLAASDHQGRNFIAYWQEIGAQLKAHLLQLQHLTDHVGKAYDRSGS